MTDLALEKSRIILTPILLATLVGVVALASWRTLDYFTQRDIAINLRFTAIETKLDVLIAVQEAEKKEQQTRMADRFRGRDGKEMLAQLYILNSDLMHKDGSFGLRIPDLNQILANSRAVDSY